MSVRLKLIIIIVFVALVPLTVSALTTLGIHQGAFEANVAELHHRTAENQATRLQAHLDGITRGLEVLTTETLSWSDLTEAERDAALWLVYRQADEVAVAVLLDDQGAVVAGPAYVDPANAGEEPEHPPISAAVTEQLRSHVPLDWSSGAKLVLGDAFTSEGLATPILPVAFEVAGKGTARWVVAVGLSLDSFCGAVRPIEGFDTIVADGKNRIVCPIPDQPLLGELSGLDTVKAATEGVGTYRATDGREMLGSVAAMPHGWYVVAQQPTEMAYGASRRIRGQTIFWIVIGLVVALAAGLFLSRSISRPIAQLVQGVRELAQGNFKHRLRMQDPDEFGRLGQAFDRMSGEIQARDAEIRSWNVELQERVADRTVELERAHQRLLHSEKVAATGTFSAGVASEVNDPLTAVLGIAQLLLARARKDPARAKDAELLGKAETEALRIRAVMRRVQTLAQEQSEARFAPVRASAVVDATLGLLEQDLAAKAVDVIRAYEQDLPLVSGSFMQLQQALLQVFTNAIDAVGEDPQIVVSTLLAGGDRVRIVVSDNGCGILPGDLASIFEPFFTTKASAEGAGLGLSIAQRIIEDHHGTVSVTSSEGEGTVVAIALPAIQSTPEIEGD